MKRKRCVRVTKNDGIDVFADLAEERTVKWLVWHMQKKAKEGDVFTLTVEYHDPSSFSGEEMDLDD